MKDENVDKYNKYHRDYDRKDSADILGIFACVDLILSILGAVLMWIFCSTTEIMGDYNVITQEYAKNIEINWLGIAGGFGLIIGGFTLFFALMTIVDIFDRVDR